MSPVESWETESKEDIEVCLNCTIPDYLCEGIGKCYIGRRRKGQLETEVLKLVLMEKKVYQMSRILKVQQKTIHATITKLVKKGIITEEQALNTHVYKTRR